MGPSRLCSQTWHWHGEAPLSGNPENYYHGRSEPSLFWGYEPHEKIKSREYALVNYKYGKDNKKNQ